MAKILKTTVVVSLVMLFSTPAFSQLLITQYYEGTNGNRWIELKNPGPGTVDLSAGGLYLGLWDDPLEETYKTDGTPSATVNLIIPTPILAGDVVLVGHGLATDPTYATADFVDSIVMNFTGDDSVALYSGGPTFATANIIDAVGFTAAGNEGQNTSWVRSDPAPGWNTTAGSNVTSFPAIWTEYAWADVDSPPATAGDEEYLGTSTVPVELQAFTIE